MRPRWLAKLSLPTFDTLVVRSLPLVPRAIVQRVAQRYVAGSSRDEAMRCIAELMRDGACATIDLLGEEVESRERARANADEYLRVLSRVTSFLKNNRETLLEKDDADEVFGLTFDY